MELLRGCPPGLVIALGVWVAAGALADDRAGAMPGQPSSPDPSDAIPCALAADVASSVDPVPPGWVADPGVDPASAGYVWAARFEAEPGPKPGYAVVMRLANAKTGESVFRGEKRSWVLVVRFDDTPESVMAHRYLGEEKPEQAWVPHSETRHTWRTPPAASPDTPQAFLCRSLAKSGLVDAVELTQVSAGRMKSKGQIRRYIDSRFSGKRR